MRNPFSAVHSGVADRIAHARLFILGAIVHWVVTDDHDETCDDEATGDHH